MLARVPSHSFLNGRATPYGTTAANRILVVEDERIVALDLADTLADLGYKIVAIAATAEDAVKQAREHQPNLVIMDIRLKGAVDGISAAQRMRSERDLPIIFLTAHSDDETLRRAKATGPFGYLVKPFNPPELRCAIEVALHKHEIGVQLQAREQWLVTTLRSIGDGVVATDANQRVQLLNPVAEALTGWTHEDACGKTFDEVLSFITEEGHRFIGNPVRSALQKKAVVSLQAGALLISKDGTTTPIDDSAAPIIDDEGTVLGGVMVFRDVRKQRLMEAEIRELNSQLEQRVAERTEQLEAANKELEAFSYSVAHDLRVPLRGIDGFSKMLIDDHAATLDAAGLEHLHRVRAATQRMAQLIDDLLRLSGITKTTFQKRSVNLSELARAVTTQLQGANPTQRVAVTIHDNVCVQGDEHLLRILLDNLIGNAWKFSEKVAAPKIEIGFIEKEGLRFYFVRDNGLGFDMKYAHRLFKPFQRLHSESEFEGTGVGLAIVQRVIDRHNGRIWVESGVGAGATFFFSL